MHLLWLNIMLIPAAVLLLRLRIELRSENGRMQCVFRLGVFRIHTGKKKSADTGHGLKKKELIKLLRLLPRALNRLRKKIKIEKIKICCIEADPDPYEAVMKYNLFNAALGSALPFVEKAFTVRNKEISTDIDLSAERSYVCIELGISVRVFELLLSVTELGYALLTILTDRRKEKYDGKQTQ